jgi:alpha-mannosidase
VLKHPSYTRDRLRQTVARLQERVYSQRRSPERLLVSPRVDRIPWAEAQNLEFEPAAIGLELGPLWATYWFRAEFEVPPEWAGARVDLLWESHSEATLWVDGRSVQGLNSRPGVTGDPAAPSVRTDAILSAAADGGERLSVQVEVACNGELGALPRPYRSIEAARLDRCEIARFDPDAWQLLWDFAVLQELEADHEHGLDESWAGELLYELNRFCNLWRAEDRATWPAARAVLTPLLTRANGARTHEVHAIGHAHLDTAWLWPIAETKRKAVRSWSSQLAYMERYPDYRFACSQAQQYGWIKREHPELYARIQEQVQAGSWVPVGGTWIEPDCNLPSGESLVRQFLLGQRFFEREFGRRCSEFWNPDVFGYNGQLPQIMRGAGITRFLTQKLSWNRFNQPPHHSFTWQGLDGSEVLAHFPPADTYNGDGTIAQLRAGARNYRDHDRSRHSMYLFGHGDGGGGATPAMLERLRRAGNLQGVLRVSPRHLHEPGGGQAR